MDALRYVIDALLSLVVFAFLLRVVLQLARADFRNPIAQAILRITNPVVLPLRRIIPPLRKLDLASIIALILVQVAATAVVLWLNGAFAFGLPVLGLLRAAAMELAITILVFYQVAIFIYILLSWVAPGTYSPASALLTAICEPVLAPARRLIPGIGGLDLSPVFVLIAIEGLKRLLPVLL